MTMREKMSTIPLGGVTCSLFAAHDIDPSRVVPGSLTLDYEKRQVTYLQAGPELMVKPFTARDVICPACGRPADAPEHAPV